MTGRHCVQAGESLFTIAQKNSTTIDKIISLNPQIAQNPDLLNVGCTLSVPSARPVPELASLTLRALPAVTTSSRTALSPLKLRSPSPPKFTKRNSRRVASHVVTEGDSLYSLSQRYNVSVEKLKNMNELTADEIQPGWTLAFPRSSQSKVKPKLVNTSLLKTDVQVEMGDTLAKIADRHNTTIRKLQDLNNLRTERIQAGSRLRLPDSDGEGREVKEGRQTMKKGYRRTRVRLFNCNRAKAARRAWWVEDKDRRIQEPADSESTDRKQRSGMIMFQNRARVRLTRGTAKRRFLCPVTDGFVSSGYGWRWGRMHEGIDLAADTGAPVYASFDGTVNYSDWNGGYGKLLCVSHGDGFSTRYAHCDELERRVGDIVRTGDRIATVGATGKATGPHLHYEVRLNGIAQDPYSFLDMRHQ